MEVAALLKKWWEDTIALDKENGSGAIDEFIQYLSIEFRTCDQDV